MMNKSKGIKIEVIANNRPMTFVLTLRDMVTNYNIYSKDNYWLGTLTVEDNHAILTCWDEVQVPYLVYDMDISQIFSLAYLQKFAEKVDEWYTNLEEELK